MPTPNGPAVSSAAASAASTAGETVKKWTDTAAKAPVTQIAAAGTEDSAVGRAAASKGNGEMTR